MSEKLRTIALAGNPNCGKTTLFNALTGAHQHVGNYSGVTVEKKEGQLRHGEREIRVIDLPGSYSLNHHSPEERVAEEELLSGDVDAIVAVVDSTALSRSLVFVTQLLQLDLPVILCLNMADEAHQNGQKLDLDQMSALLGCPIVETAAPVGMGVEQLKDAIVAAVGDTGERRRPKVGAMDDALEAVAALLPADRRHPYWLATKLLHGEAQTVERLTAEADAKVLMAIQKAKQERAALEEAAGAEIHLIVTQAYYGFVDGLLREVVEQPLSPSSRQTSNKIDSIVAHPFLGLPIFLLIVYALFWLTFELGAYPMEWIEAGFGALADAISGAWPEGSWSAVRSLVIDGIIGGAGGVVVFLPNIVILFLGISFLEDTGYMARSAFLMDKLMHRVGLHGRSFIPLITGFGCSIPAIMATRTIAGEKERLTTMFIVPLMSCGARLPIWMLLVPAFFAKDLRASVMMGIYLFGVVVALILAFVLRKSLFKGAEEPFVMELPPYRMPTLRAILMHMFERSWLYLKKAGTIILAVSIVLWFLMSYPKPSEEQVAEVSAAAAATYDANPAIAEAPVEVDDAATIAEAGDDSAGDEEGDEADEAPVDPRQAYIDNVVADAELQHSVAGRMGRGLSMVFQPMGFDWRIGTAMIGAIAAKEVFVAQMGIVYSLGEADEENASLRENIKRDYPTKTGIALIIFLLISAPCMATVAIMKRESGRWKWALLQFFGLTFLAYILALIAYQVLSVAGF